MSFYAISAVIVAALGGFLFGYNTAVIAGALLFIKAQFQLTPALQGWTVSIILLGALIAAIIGGMVCDWIGRKKSILLSAVLFIVGCFVAAKAGDDTMFTLGRFITGLGVGLTSVATPMYLSEISPAKHRGAIVTCYQLAITIGILVAYFVNYGFAKTSDWSSMMAWGSAAAILQIILSPLLLESPRWLHGIGKVAKAKKIQHKLNLKESIEESTQDKRTHWGALFRTPALRKAVVVGLFLSIFQQVTGINVVIYYAPQIFDFVGFPSNEVAILGTVGIGTINVIATLFALWLLDKAGRRMLLLVGLVGMVVGLLLLSISFFAKSDWTNYLALVGMMGYVAMFAIGLGPCAWVVISEIYPLAVRGKAMGLATLANWVFNYIVALLFLDVVQWLGAGSTFLLFVVLCVAAFIFIFRMLPETKNKHLGEIQRLFS